MEQTECDSIIDTLLTVEYENAINSVYDTIVSQYEQYYHAKKDKAKLEILSKIHDYTFVLYYISTTHIDNLITEIDDYKQQIENPNHKLISGTDSIFSTDFKFKPKQISPILKDFADKVILIQEANCELDSLTKEIEQCEEFACKRQMDIKELINGSKSIIDKMDSIDPKMKSLQQWLQSTDSLSESQKKYLNNLLTKYNTICDKYFN